MYGMMVDEYFLVIEKGLKNVVDGPIFANDQTAIGKIIWYNPKNGYARIELIEEIDYRTLLNNGIPLDNIVFKNRA